MTGWEYTTLSVAPMKLHGSLLGEPKRGRFSTKAPLWKDE